MEACLAATPKPDLLVNLGDIVGYGGSPNEVTERSRETGAVFVRGNHDKACTGVSGLEDFNPVASVAALWTKQMLLPENLQWLRNLPQGPVLLEGLQPAGENSNGSAGQDEDPGNSNPDTHPGQHSVKHPKVQCVHGSPLDEDEYIIVMRDAYQPLMTTDAALTFFGHTHIQGGFCTHGEEWETLRPVYRSKKEIESCDLLIMPGAKYLINPGSVGQPRDGDWRAACALYDSEQNRITFYRIPYNVKKAQERILLAKLPDRLALRLSEGR